MSNLSGSSTNRLRGMLFLTSPKLGASAEDGAVEPPADAPANGVRAQVEHIEVPVALQFGEADHLAGCLRHQRPPAISWQTIEFADTVKHTVETAPRLERKHNCGRITKEKLDRPRLQYQRANEEGH